MKGEIWGNQLGPKSQNTEYYFAVVVEKHISRKYLR
jgi:hypothetical protein